MAAMEGEEGSTGMKRLGGETIKEVCGSVEGLDPIGRGETGLEQQGTHNVVGGTDNAFSLAILGGGVRA